MRSSQNWKWVVLPKKRSRDVTTKIISRLDDLRRIAAEAVKSDDANRIEYQDASHPTSLGFPPFSRGLRQGWG